MGKKKFLMIMLICLSMILAFQSINLQGFFFIPDIETTDVLELTDDTPHSIMILSGQSEVGFGKGVGEFFSINNTEISMTLIHPSKTSAKLDPLLFNVSFLEEEGYLEDGAVPVIIQLSDCKPPKSTETIEIQAENAKQTKKAISSARGILSSEVKEYKLELESICSISADVELDNIKSIIDSEIVSKVYLDQKYTVMLNDTIPIIGADSIWNITEGNNSINGTGVVIAILDTGLNFTHPDFQGKLIWAESFNGESVQDNHNHGTHCAGIAAGTGEASDGQFKGVAPGADLMIGKVLSDMGYGYTSWIIAGIEWATNPSIEPSVSGDKYIVNPLNETLPGKADVISLSLGGYSTDGNDPLSLAVDSAVDAGVVVVVAAGNSEEPVPMSISAPGVARKAITVGASAKNDTIADFSNIGPTSDGRLKPEIVSTGVSICSAKALGFLNESACGDDDYWPLSGTSMATPNVAGAAALLLQKHPDWTPENVKSALVLTAVDLGDSAFNQGSGRIAVQKAINTSILTSPAVLDLKVIANNTSYSEITITNIADEPIEINLNVSELISEGNFSEDINNYSYHVPIAVSKLSRVFVGVTYENGTLSQPSYAVLYQPNNFSKLIVWQSYGTDEYNHTFLLSSGKYTLHVLGDLNNFDLNYALGAEFELGKGEQKEFLFNLSDAKKINLPLYSKDEVPLDVYRFESLIVCYYPTEPTRIRLLNLFWGFGEPVNTTFYVSESTCENRSIQLQARGSPTRGHFQEWEPGLDLYTNISGKEWAWRWENRDISDEDYLLAWNLKGNITEDMNLTFDMNKTSIFKEFYNFAGYAPFTQTYSPQNFMARVVFWLAPDWFEAMSYMKRPSAPVNRTVYAMGDGWVYRGYAQVRYPNSTSQSTTLQNEYPLPYNGTIAVPTGIRISDTPINRTHYFGTPPYQLPYLINSKSNNRIYIASNKPLVTGYNNSVIIDKGYDSIVNPRVFIYNSSGLLYEFPDFNLNYIWSEGIINLSNPYWPKPNFLGYDIYKINFTVPLKYSVFNNIELYAEINFNESTADINPPNPTRFFVEPSYDYNVSIPVEVEFAEELATAEMYYKTDLTEWIPMDFSNNGTFMNSSINITDGESKNISLKFKVSDAFGNNVTYEITSVSVLYRDISINLQSNQSSAYLGETILFNGTVYDPLDPNFSGIKLKYFVNGEYIDFDRTDFQENLNTIDTRMPSYMMCMGCFEKEFVVPEDFEDSVLNFTVLFEGSGPYKPFTESVLIDINSVGYGGDSQQQSMDLLSSNEDFIETQDISDKEIQSITIQQTNDDLIYPAEELPITTKIEINQTKIVLQPGENATILVNASIATGSEGAFYGYLLINTAPFVEEEDGDDGSSSSGSSGSSGGGIVPVTTTSTTAGTSVFYNVVAGDTIYMEPTWRMDLAVSSIVFSESADELKVSIAKTEPSVQSNGEVYMTFSINSDATVSDATIEFRVSKSWLEKTGSSADDVRLAREDGTKLSVFETRITREDNDYVYFESEVDHFSTFSIITMEQKTLNGFFGILQKIEGYYSGSISFADLVTAISEYFSK